MAALPDGTALYVPFTLPGEWIRAEPVARRGEGWAARAAPVLSPSDDRIAPPCPHFGACGGCALQHWRDAPYAAWKAGLLEAALRRAGFADPPIAPLAGTSPGTRRRMDLAIRRRPGGATVGLHAPHTADVIDLATCEVLHPTLVALIGALRAVLPTLGALRREASAVVNLLAEGPDLLLRTDGDLGTTDRTKLAAFADAHGLPRITWAGGTGAPEPACLLRPPTIRFADVPVRPPPGAFLQASAEGEAAIVAAVLAGLPDRLAARARIVELYAGCGTLTFPLARHARVVAYEGDAAAVAAVRAAAGGAGQGGRIEAVVRDLVRQPLTPADLAGAAAVVLDPPWAGAAAQMPAIAAARVPRVICVSCNPVALARDARVLHDGGYAVIAATPVDQFLWSPRLESVVVFAR